MASDEVALGTPAGRWVLGVTVLGSGMGFLDATVVTVALPSIGDDLDAAVAGLQWTLNGYLLTLAALLLLGGALGDRYGRRRVFAVGVAWFTVASLLCALAPTVEALIAARVLQGIGGALFTPGSLAIIEASFRVGDRGRAIGAWSAYSGLATAVGPLVGGYLVDALSWRWIFLLNVPVGAAVVVLAGRRVPESRDPGAEGRVDLAGGALATTGLAGVTFALIEGPGRGFGSPLVVAALVIGVGGLAMFPPVERRVRAPLLPLRIFTSGQFAAANAVTFVVYAALGGVLFLLTVFLQGSLGYSALEAGAATLPITALLLVLSPRMGALAQRTGPRAPLAIGPVVLAAAMLLMTTIDRGDGYARGVLPSILVFGLGLSAVVAPVTATVLAAAEQRNAGIASAVNNAVARVAQLLAVAVLPVAGGLSGDDYRRSAALADAFHEAMVVAALVAIAGGLLAAVTIRSEVLTRRGLTPASDHR